VINEDDVERAAQLTHEEFGLSTLKPASSPMQPPG